MSTDVTAAVTDPQSLPPDPGVATAGPIGRWRRRWLQAAVLLLPAVGVGVMGWTKRSMYDDGFIYLRIVQNVLAGNGPVFNAGERVEVYTGVLWVGVLSILGAVTSVPLEWVAVITGVVMTVGGVLLATYASARLVRRAAPTAFLLPLGMVVFASVAVVWTYVTTGLETGLTFLWLAGCLAVLVHWSDRSHRPVPWPGLMILGLGPLVRPELALDSAVFLAVVLGVGWRSLSWWGRCRVLVLALAVPVAYQVFRMAYFGSVVANTAIAKEGTMPRPDQGWAFLLDFVGPYLLVVPAVALLLGAYLPLALTLRSGVAPVASLGALLALPIAGILNAAYIALMGGDYLHGRLLLPAFFAMLAPVAVVPVGRRYAVALLVAPWALASMLVLRTTDTWSVPFGHIRNDGIVTPEQWDWRATNVTAEQATSLAVKFGSFNAPVFITAPLRPGLPRPAVATGAIGLQSYALGTQAYVFDYLGLAEPLAAHLELTGRGTTGHEKNLPTPWLAALLTAEGADTAEWDAVQPMRDSIMIYRPLIPNATGAELARQTQWARAALQCPAIAELRARSSDPLTLDRAVANVTGALRASQLRIPADPEQAHRKFCGD